MEALRLRDSLVRRSFGDNFWRFFKIDATFHSYLENFSLCRGDALNFLPFLIGKGASCVGFMLVFPRDVKRKVRSIDVKVL